jgi:tetratricopeptide (TPR) repeat protein
MSKSVGSIVLLFWMLFSLPLSRPPLLAQTPSATAASDYSKEPFVIEQYAKKDSFENDGRYTELTTVRVRVQSTTAVRQFGVVRLPYASSSGNIEVLYVKVMKPDGTVVVTPAEDIQDMPADITRDAPFYSDLKEKQLAVKGLEIGDLLEYQTRLSVTTPLIPGQFWFADDFPSGAIVLAAELQVSVPRDRYVKLQSPVLAPATTEENGYRIYTWRTSNLKHASQDDQDSKEQDAQTPAVQLTTFRNWDEVARWYRDLQQGRVAATPEIRAKALELTRGATSDAEKIQLLYSYVATQFRYIGIAFGIGRYQAHSAADVLGNGYGDCKDKDTLLSALLAASGIKSYPALLNSSRSVDPDIPSPSQFDHVITVVPQDKGLLWLDTTTEIAPEGYLTSDLRNKLALMIPDAGPAQLIKTPAAPPYDTSYDFQITGKLTDVGTLEAQVDASVRGDMEYLLRSALHGMPMTLWPNLVQAFAGNMGFPGTVDSAMVSSPEDTAQPLHMSYGYTRPDYIDWAKKQMSPPLPHLTMPDLPAEGTTDSPIALQAPGRYSFDAKIELPAGFMPQLPAPVDVKQDFAEYHASYSLEGNTLHAQRTLAIHMKEIPQFRREEYLALRKAVTEDEQFFISLSSLSSQWIQDGREAASHGDVSVAIQFLEAAVATDPQSSEAWLTLGNVHALSGSADQGISEMKKAIDLSPKDYASYRTLVDALSYLHRYPEALEALQQADKISPNNIGVTWRTAQALLEMKRPGEAAAALLPAMEKNPKDARLALLLGQAYIRQGEEEKGMNAFQTVLEGSPTSATLSVVARELADHDLRLNDALRYSQQAVAMQEDVTAKFSIDTLTMNNMVEMIRLAQAWDTAGWTYFRQGNLTDAGRYFTSAWKLLQSPVIADHLGQLNEMLGKKQEAERFYTLALATGQGSQETGSKLAALLGGVDQAAASVRTAMASGDLDRVRAITLPRVMKGAGKANFFLLFAQGSSAPQVEFLGGSEELKGAVSALTAATYDVGFPDDRHTNIVQQGTLTCDEASPNCQLLFTRLDIVNPIN